MKKERKNLMWMCKRSHVTPNWSLHHLCFIKIKCWSSHWIWCKDHDKMVSKLWLNLKPSFMFEQFSKRQGGLTCQALSISKHHSFLTTQDAQGLQNVLEMRFSCFQDILCSPLHIHPLFPWCSLLPGSRKQCGALCCRPELRKELLSSWQKIWIFRGKRANEPNFVEWRRMWNEPTSFCLERSSRRLQAPWCDVNLSWSYVYLWWFKICKVDDDHQ